MYMQHALDYTIYEWGSAIDVAHKVTIKLMAIMCKPTLQLCPLGVAYKSANEIHH